MISFKIQSLYDLPMHIASFFVNTLVAWAAAVLMPVSLRQKIPWRGIFLTFSFIAFFWILFSLVFYLLMPSYYDHGEMSVAGTAAYWLSGHPLYTKADSASIYSLLYSPLTFLCNSLFQLLPFGTILTSKLPGVAACLGSALLFYLITGRLKAARAEAALAMGIFLCTLLSFDTASFWDRPDSYLIFLSLISLYVIERWGSRFQKTSVVILGTAAGFSVGFKLHGFIYIIPLYAYLFETSGGRNPGPFFCRTLTSGLIGILLFFGLFLLPGVSFSDFLILLHRAASQGLETKLLCENLTFMAPFLFVLNFNFNRHFKFTFITMLACVFLVCVIASKTGAGTHHLLPFLPVIIYFAAQSELKIDFSAKTGWHLFLGAAFIALIYGGFVSQKELAKFFLERPKQVKEFAELQTYASAYPGTMELGYAGLADYEKSFYKPYLVGKKNVLLLDAAALMDREASGEKIPFSTFKEISDCRIAYFILPKSKTPWTMPSYYHQELFDDQWRTNFFNSYKKIKSGDTFELYRCHPR